MTGPRLIEQACHIQSYQRRILADEGRALTNDEAAAEWIALNAEHFPTLEGHDEGSKTVQESRTE